MSMSVGEEGGPFYSELRLMWQLKCFDCHALQGVCHWGPIWYEEDDVAPFSLQFVEDGWQEGEGRVSPQWFGPMPGLSEGIKFFGPKYVQLTIFLTSEGINLWRVYR